jgi:hypothetical protein
VIVFLLASFYPTFVLYTAPLRPDNPIHRPFWMSASLVILILLSVGAAWAPMALGRRKLQKLED